MEKQIKIATVALGVVLAFGSALPALASALATGINTPAAAPTADATPKIDKTAKTDEAKIADFIKRADQEITRRITALNSLSTRVSAMVKISDAQKTNLNAMIQDQITTLGTLKTKIDADTDLATVRTDVQSITKSYRIFMLVVPRGFITAAADRIITITDQMTTLNTKLQTRIGDAKSAGKDTSAIDKLITDYTTKIGDAKTQAQSALSGISGLAPDNGDKTLMASNTAALKDAKTKIEAAQKDVLAAQKDAKTIAKDLKALGVTGTSASGTNSN